jgi:predicted heme/steroid binding protein
LVGVFILLLAAGPAYATQQYANQTNKPCSYCHQSGGGSTLNRAGRAFAAAGFQLPGATTTTTAKPPGGTTSTTKVMTGSGVSPGAALLVSTTTTQVSAGTDVTSLDARPLVRLPWLLRDLLLWVHLVAVVAWLGAIIFVHIVQTPRVAGQGIPRRYLYLAWPSIAALAVSGTLLTLDDVTGFSQLTDSRWGKLLLVKIFMYLVLVAVAAMATFVLSPRLRRQSESAGDRFAKLHERAREAGVVTASYEGVVYDLTDSRIWRNGRHARRHDAWSDLSGEMAEAPHGPEVLDRFPVVEGTKPVMFPVQRVFVAVAYGNLALVLLVLLVVAFWR